MGREPRLPDACPCAGRVPVASEPAPGRTFSLGSQTAQGLPLEPGFGVVRVHLGYSVTVSCRCFFELQKLLVCTKIKTDLGSPRSLAAWKGVGLYPPPPSEVVQDFGWKGIPPVLPALPRAHPGDAPRGRTQPPGAAPAALKAETHFSGGV